MRIFLAGGSGVVGSRLVPLLARVGYDVVATTRTPAKLERLRRLGAEPLLLDVLDGNAVLDAVVEAAPDVVVHQATALVGVSSLRRFDQAFEATNQLRTLGTDLLVTATRAAGARRFVAQSFAGWPYGRAGGIKSEDDPFDPDPPKPFRRSLTALLHLERTALEAEGVEGVVLRYGPYYGPGTSLGSGGVYVEMVRQRRFPIVGKGRGVWSFVHIDDVARATLAAIERGAPGIYNVVDDEPAPVAEWLPALAAAIGAPEPRRVPRWLGRLGAGEAGVTFMCDVRGASNAKAKRELHWQPRWPSWRQGFVEALAGSFRG